MKIKEIMQCEVSTVGQDTPAGDAYHLMRSHKFRHLPVVSENDELIGVLSDRDIRNIMVPFENRPEESDDFVIPPATTVGEIMTRNPVTISQEDDVLLAAETICEKRFGCLPVTQDGKLVGFLTEMDLLRLLVKLLKAP